MTVRRRQAELKLKKCVKLAVYVIHLDMPRKVPVFLCTIILGFKILTFFLNI